LQLESRPNVPINERKAKNALAAYWGKYNEKWANRTGASLTPWALSELPVDGIQ